MDMMSSNAVRGLAERVYPALAAGDRDTLTTLLSPDFQGHFSPGLPAPIGGTHVGPQECIERGWWAIGARWAVRAEPERWVPCGDAELLVLGTYRGRGRATGKAFEAPFAHLWTARGDRLGELRQFTDTALWVAALEETP
ncbi:nuclear transport factor 2 family protein [Pseudonocardia eucalypti]|uniref:Nuclear transport factor 2 family protein n=2 Tax=Pseudonocardia eucalypti TaxID=648755 RepID=A0ABP9QDY2_9PSEU